MDIKYKKAELCDCDYIKNIIRNNLGEVINISFKGSFDYDSYVDGAVRDKCSYIILCDKKACGFLWYTLKGMTLHINTIVLSEEHQSRGIGKIVFEEIEALAKTVHMKFLQLGVQGSNERAKKFYERIGFKEHGYLKQLDTFYMQKNIN